MKAYFDRWSPCEKQEALRKATTCFSPGVGQGKKRLPDEKRFDQIETLQTDLRKQGQALKIPLSSMTGLEKKLQDLWEQARQSLN